MWVKFKKHFSRSKGYEEEPAPPQPNNFNRGNIVLKSFKKIPSSYVGFGDGELITTEQVPLNNDSSEACKCGPQLTFHKQLFGSFKNKRQENSLDGCAVPNIENSEDPRTGCVSTFKSTQNERLGNVLSPRSLHQSWIESPKRGCFAQGCIPNSDGCHHSPVLDNHMNGSDPVMCKQFYDDNRPDDRSHNNNEFRKVLENGKFPPLNHQTKSEFDTKYEIEQLKNQIESLTLDAFDDDDYIDDLNELRKIKANDLMTTSDVTNGSKVSPPKMKRREKARPVSALEPRRNHIQPLDFSNLDGKLSSNRLELPCPISKTCVPNIADILDDAVYCMEVSNNVRTHLDVQDLCLQNGRKSVEINRRSPLEMLSEPYQTVLECNSLENTKPERFSLTKNGCDSYQVAETDESNGKESGYTTLEDVQMLISQTPQVSSYLEKVDKTEHIWESSRASNDLPLDYSVKNNQFNEFGYEVPNPGDPLGRCAVDGVLSLKLCKDSGWSGEPQAPSGGLDFSMRPVENAYILSEMSPNAFFPDSGKNSNDYMEPLATNEVIDLRKCRQDATLRRTGGTRVQEFHASDLTVKYSADPKAESNQVLAYSSSYKKTETEWSNEIYFQENFGNSAAEAPNGIDSATDARKFSTNSDLDPAIDSDDGEYLPPLPSRNYVTYVNSSAAISAPKEKKASSETSEVLREQTHMTWDEIMQEAKSLGIPLSAPPTESLGRVSSVSSMASSQLSLGSEDRSSSPVLETVGEILPDEENAGSGLPLDLVPRRDGASKEKFRLQNPFSRKTRNGNHSQMSSNGGIQTRCLPPVPLAISVGNADALPSSGAAQPPAFLGKPTRRTLSNVHLSESDSGSNSVWGSSISVPAQFLSSSNGASGSMKSLASNISNGSSPGSSSALANPALGTNGDLSKSFVQLKDCGWYWGPLGWENAEAMLGDKPDGSFLVRDSSDDRYILSLSFRSQSITHHTRIEHYKGMFSFYSQPKSHGASTIVEFIEKAMEHSRSGKFLYFLRPRAPGHAPAPVQLLHPVSRMRSMHSLQHICRFRIVRVVRRDLIDRLPIPPRLKEYLKQTQYYVEGDTSDEHQYFNQDW